MKFVHTTEAWQMGESTPLLASHIRYTNYEQAAQYSDGLLSRIQSSSKECRCRITTASTSRNSGRCCTYLKEAPWPYEILSDDNDG